MNMMTPATPAKRTTAKRTSRTASKKAATPAAKAAPAKAKKPEAPKDEDFVGEKPTTTAAADDIEWLEELPTRTSKRTGKYDSFFAKLRNAPTNDDGTRKWAPWPGNRSATVQINNGVYAGIEEGEFEAVTRNGKVFVRFVGDDA